MLVGNAIDKLIKVKRLMNCAGKRVCETDGVSCVVGVYCFSRLHNRSSPDNT